MKSIKKILISFLLLQQLLTFNPNQAQAQNNPVVDRVADAGVINFNGKYYLAGVFTNGGFYVSNDLIKWDGPVHVFSMNNEWTKGRSSTDDKIHAADIHYWNGKFHFFWSVNYWGVKDMVVHIGHAVSDNILGPFTEPVKNSWFTDRIDAEMFIDDDSSMYFYSVKFTDGNTIWGQPMSDPWTLKDEPEHIFSSLPETWEQYDNKVIEGPWVMKYRSKYYMMYNANHTSNQYGNYALGVAQSDKPLGFNTGNKYPQPVVQSNLTDNPEDFRYYFTSSKDYFANWMYITSKPADDWMKSDFNDSDWKNGQKGFGSQDIKGSTVMRRETDWNSQDIWVRKKFSLDPSPSDNLQLLVNHTGPVEVYIDGDIVYSNTGSDYSTVNLPPEVKQKLKNGNNLITMHSQRGRRSSFLDVELVDPLSKPGDDILFNPGQPNIVRGPNGIEWWLVYFGIKNGGPRSQFVNRVIFQDRELTVDGPTGIKTSGYHPNPSLPVFGEVFDSSGADLFKNKWITRSGKWEVKNNELAQIDSTSKMVALINSHNASNYLFKSGIKNDSYKNGNAGVVGYFLNSDNYFEVGFNQSERIWFYRISKGGKKEIKKNKLSAEFNFNVYHSITVLKNSSRFEVLIDDNPAPGNNIVNSSFVGKGICGLFTENCKASFDGVIYTPGWDEFDKTISGWSNSLKGEKMSGKWTINENGICQLNEIGNYSTFKGDLLDQYEFGAQLYRTITSKDQAYGGACGIYPVYIDRENYLQASIDFKKGKLNISGKKNNLESVNEDVPLKRTLCKYPDPKYGDSFMKVYTLKSSTDISSMEIVKSVYNKEDFSINSFDSLKIFYRKSGIWYPLDFRVVSRENSAINKIEFNRVTADALKLVSSAADNTVHVYKLYVTEEKTSDYNLRAVKLTDRVIIFLDGKQVAEVKDSWPASQVGLFTRDQSVRLNGITLFEK
jgi:GH43 family beta-xylosidase